MIVCRSKIENSVNLSFQKLNGINRTTFRTGDSHVHSKLTTSSTIEPCIRLVKIFI